MFEMYDELLPAMLDDLPAEVRLVSARLAIDDLEHQAQLIEEVDTYLHDQLLALVADDTFRPMHLRLANISHQLENGTTDTKSPKKEAESSRDIAKLLAELHPDANDLSVDEPVEDPDDSMSSDGAAVTGSDTDVVAPNATEEKTATYKAITGAKLEGNSTKLFLATARGYTLLVRDQIAALNSAPSTQALEQIEVNRYKAHVALQKVKDGQAVKTKEEVDAIVSEHNQHAEAHNLASAVLHVQTLTLDLFGIEPNNPLSQGRLNIDDLEDFASAFNSLGGSIQEFMTRVKDPRLVKPVNLVSSDIEQELDSWVNALEAMANELANPDSSPNYFTPKTRKLRAGQIAGINRIIRNLSFSLRLKNMEMRPRHTEELRIDLGKIALSGLIKKLDLSFEDKNFESY